MEEPHHMRNRSVYRQMDLFGNLHGSPSYADHEYLRVGAVRPV